MIRMYFFTIYLLFGCLLLQAQSPCSDFNSTTNPQGNWNTAPYPNGNVMYSSASPNVLDGSQYLTLEDQSGGSFFINTTDFKNLGQRFLGQCLYFDFYLEKDGNFGSPVHPAINIMADDKIITFTANITVTPNSGWVRVRAPIANSNGSSFPSNSEGSWSMLNGTYAEFNNVMNNSTAVMISPDYTSNIGERVWYDNICIKSCDGCSADFKLETLFGSNTNASTAKLTITNPILVSTPTNPGSTYTVTWGDGTSSAYTLTTLTHTYANYGTYTICVTEKQGKLVLCTRCFTFCYAKASVPSKEINPVNTKPQIDIRAIGKSELSTENNDYQLVPNPAKNYVDIQANLLIRGLVSIRVIDMSGKTVLEKSETLESDHQNIKLNTEKLIQGSYIVEIKSANKTNSQKLLISK